MASRRGDDIRGDTHYSVGMQVLVRTDSLMRPSATGRAIDLGGARLSGVIVEPGGAQQSSFIAFGSNQPNTWIVAFDEPFTAPDGSGPHESAEVNEIYLLPAPSDDGAR